MGLSGGVQNTLSNGRNYIIRKILVKNTRKYGGLLKAES
jgi:hypothetical protein